MAVCAAMACTVHCAARAQHTCVCAQTVNECECRVGCVGRLVHTGACRLRAGCTHTSTRRTHSAAQRCAHDFRSTAARTSTQHNMQVNCLCAVCVIDVLYMSTEVTHLCARFDQVLVCPSHHRNPLRERSTLDGSRPPQEVDIYDSIMQVDDINTIPLGKYACACEMFGL